MTERDTELSKRLVIGHKRDGRACYDKEAKRELIEACLRSGISVARVALVHGINAGYSLGLQQTTVQDRKRTVP
jgi:transposase